MTYILISIFVVLLCYFAGHILLSFVAMDDVSREERFFSKLMAGMLVSLTLFAVASTAFRTQLSGLLLVFLIVASYLYRRKKIALLQWIIRIKSIEWSEITLFGVFLVCAVSYPLVFYGMGWLHHAVNMDFSFYSAVAENLASSGVETYRITECFIDPANTSPELYHYFELWLVAMVNIFSGKTALNTLVLLSIPCWYRSCCMLPGLPAFRWASCATINGIHSLL